MELWEARPVCGLCGQDIHHIDDAEVDHIVPWSQGGKTVRENARLVHRLCNRWRGTKDPSQLEWAVGASGSGGEEEDEL